MIFFSFQNSKPERKFNFLARKMNNKFLFLRHLYNLTEKNWDQVGFEPTSPARHARDVGSSPTWSYFFSVKSYRYLRLTDLFIIIIITSGTSGTTKLFYVKQT